MNKLPTFHFWLGCLTAAAVFAAGMLGIAGWPEAQDALLWRLEGAQSRPTLSQRVYERKLTEHHMSQDRLVPPGSLLFFGDSHIQSLPLGGLSQAYNFAIGGETAQRLAKRLPRYTSLSTARAVVIGAGTNDLFEGSSPQEALVAWRDLLGQLPAPLKVVCVEIPLNRAVPHTARTQETVNIELSRLCQERGHPVVSVNRGANAPLDAGFAPDGIHLTADGSRLLLSRIEDLLKRTE